MRMRIDRLFGALVLGGAALGCDGSAIPEGPESIEDGGVSDALLDANEFDASDPDAAEPDASEGIEPPEEGPMDCGFCPSEICCDSSGELREGMMCCWSTSC